MLVLSRKERQRIKLGDSIVVTVVRVAGDKVRLGIEAPSDMLVLREELEAHNSRLLAASTKGFPKIQTMGLSANWDLDDSGLPQQDEDLRRPRPAGREPALDVWFRPVREGLLVMARAETPPAVRPHVNLAPYLRFVSSETDRSVSVCS